MTALSLKHFSSLSLLFSFIFSLLLFFLKCLLEGNLLGSLGFLSENRLGLTTKTWLLSVVTSSTYDILVKKEFIKYENNKCEMEYVCVHICFWEKQSYQIDAKYCMKYVLNNLKYPIDTQRWGSYF